MEVGFEVKMGDTVFDPLAVVVHAVDTNVASPAVVVP